MTTSLTQGDNIVFEFYDDEPDTLSILNQVFSSIQSLMPHNVELHFHYYSGGSFTQNCKPSVKGTGKIDTKYNETLIKMVTEMKGISEAELETIINNDASQSITSDDLLSPTYDRLRPYADLNESHLCGEAGTDIVTATSSEAVEPPATISIGSQRGTLFAAPVEAKPSVVAGTGVSTEETSHQEPALNVI